MSIAQVELMYSDCAVTVYPKTDKCKGGRGGKREIEFERMTKSSQDVARQRWEKMKYDKAHGIDRGFTKGFESV